MADKSKGGQTDSKGGSELSDEFRHLLEVLADKTLAGAGNKVEGITGKLTGNGNGTGKAVGKAGEKLAEGKSPVTAGLAAGAEGIKDKVKGVFGKGGGGKGGKKTKVTNIIESIDVGAPIDVVYNQWTQFQDFSNFMKKVDNVDQQDEQKLTFKAQVFWSHRTWEATILEQVPDDRIVWRSKGEKGKVDGAVTFHELAPNLTRVLVVLEYTPQGLFERTGNLWRAQGRRARLELKHFRRHVMTQSMLHPDELEGWRGEIHDGKVVKTHEEVVEEEQNDADDEYSDDDEEQDAYDDEADEDEADEDEADEDEADEEQDAYDDDEEEQEDDEEDEDDRPRSRRRSKAGRR
jgi:uncharacterized membrane protein